MAQVSGEGPDDFILGEERGDERGDEWAEMFGETATGDSGVGEGGRGEAAVEEAMGGGVERATVGGCSHGIGVDEKMRR